MKAKILITVKGGLITDISANTDMEIWVADHDTEEVGEELLSERAPIVVSSKQFDKKIEALIKQK